MVRPMPERLARYFTHPTAVRRENALEVPGKDEGNWLKKVFATLRFQTGHDFSHYKVNTLLRRINRRMGLNQIADPDRYLRFCKKTLSKWKRCSAACTTF